MKASAGFEGITRFLLVLATAVIADDDIGFPALLCYISPATGVKLVQQISIAIIGRLCNHQFLLLGRFI